VNEEWFQTAFGAHYPLLYTHRDEAEAERCLTLLPKLAPLSGPVLDLGCGDGRHLDILRRSGYEVTGLDLSFHLLRVARSRDHGSGGSRLIRGDMRQIPLAKGSFGSILSLFTAFGYFGSQADNMKPINEISRVLKGGGHWFLDYFDGDRVRAELGDGAPRERIRDIGPLRVSEVRRLEFEGDQVVKQVTLIPRQGFEQEAAEVNVGQAGLSYTERVAVFSLSELDRMAEAGGLIRVSQSGGYEGQELGTGTRWILVFEKAGGGGDRDI